LRRVQLKAQNPLIPGCQALRRGHTYRSAAPSNSWRVCTSMSAQHIMDSTIFESMPCRPLSPLSLARAGNQHVHRHEANAIKSLPLPQPTAKGAARALHKDVSMRPALYLPCSQPRRAPASVHARPHACAQKCRAPHRRLGAAGRSDRQVLSRGMAMGGPVSERALLRPSRPAGSK